MTQRDRVLHALRDGAWHCGSEWLSSYLYVYSQRISEINAEHPNPDDSLRPARIESRPCQQHDHGVFEYRDREAAKPKQLELVA